jgi:SNF2 family DNA or RNA helicase
LIASCLFSHSKPKLSFEVAQTNQQLYIKTNIEIDYTKYQLSDFKRYAFLIGKENTYYILTIDEYLLLEYLNSDEAKKYGGNKSLFMQYVVSRLEPKYKVDKHHFFATKLIETEPKNCVYLSEVNSGAFLMLTPQWKYDDVLVEGEFKDTFDTKIGGELFSIKRNNELERNFIAELQQTHPNFIKQRNNYFYLSFDEAKKKNWFLKLYHKLLEENIEIIGMDMLQHFRYSPFPVETVLDNIKTFNHLIEAQLTVSFGEEKVNLNELQKVIQNEQRSVLLKDNSIGVLTDEWIEQYALIIKHSKINKNTITFPKWLLVRADESGKLTNLKFVIDKSWWEKWNTWQQIDSQLYEIPQTICATLRNYQQKGFEWLCLLAEINAGACLADDMGLGKTLQTICFMAYQLEKNPTDKFLIVCPSSLIYNWKNELEKFLPSASAYTYYGVGRNFNDYMQSGANVLITAYSTLRVDVDLFKDILWNTTILDESHNIKSLYAQTTKAVYEITSKHKIALSGTPIMNNTFDLYSQINYLLPNFLGSQEFFRQEYVIPIDRNKNEKKTEALQKLTAPFILRRTKQQVATDLPEKTELTLWCDMEDEQREIYEDIKSQIKQSIFLNIKNDGLAKSKLNILQGIIKLRQVCCSPVLLKEEDIRSKASVKIKILTDEIVNNLSKNKVLVFSQFKGMLHLIAEELDYCNISYFHFDGDTPVLERQRMVSEFQQEGNTTQVFLMSLKTGNAGITLTAADYVFLVDPWWNTAIQQQAIDRTHRIGQTTNVFAYKMICKDTIEEKILTIQNNKQATSDALIVAEENFVKNLTQEDIAFLFS